MDDRIAFPTFRDFDEHGNAINDGLTPHEYFMAHAPPSALSARRVDIRKVVMQMKSIVERIARQERRWRECYANAMLEKKGEQE